MSKNISDTCNVLVMFVNVATLVDPKELESELLPGSLETGHTSYAFQEGNQPLGGPDLMELRDFE